MGLGKNSPEGREVGNCVEAVGTKNSWLQRESIPIEQTDAQILVVPEAFFNFLLQDSGARSA